MKKSGAAVIFIFFTVLIDVIGFGIIIPVLPKLLSDLMHIDVNEASKYGGYLLASFAIFQFVFSPIMGSLSDMYGRRPILLLSLLGLGLDYIVMAFAPNFVWLLIGRMIAGIGGASYTTASAYIADVSTEENRSKNFGMIGAAFGLGFVIGPMLGGFLGELGVRIPFFTAAGLSILNFLYGYYIIPESLKSEYRRPFDWKRANPIGTFKHLLSYRSIRLLLFAYFFLNMGSHAVHSVWSYFTMYRFAWSEWLVGMSLAFVGLLVGVVQVSLAQKAAHIFGVPKSIIYGFGLYTIGMFLFAFASSSWMMFAILVPYCLGGIGMPNLQSYMTSSINKNEQGELQGGLASIASMTTIFGPILMTGIFYNFTSDNSPVQFPGASFSMGGIFMLVAFLLVNLVFRKS